MAIGRNNVICKFRGNKWDLRFPSYVSLKYDGEFNWLMKKDNNIYLVNKWNRIRKDLNILDNIKRLNLPNNIYFCELYYNEGKTKEDFYNLLRNKTSPNLNIAIWGAIGLSGKDTFNLLNKYKNKKGFAPYWEINNRKELNILINKYIINNNYEGLIIRREDSYFNNGKSKYWIKVKRKDRELNYKNCSYGIWI